MASAPTPALPPAAAHARSTLLSLPTEIKAYLVKLARQQDFAYQQRVAESVGKDKETLELLKRTWHGRSANALFLVNKELSGLAAAYVFEVINVKHCDKPVFEFRIRDLYASHLRKVIIGSDASRGHTSFIVLVSSSTSPHLDTFDPTAPLIDYVLPQVAPPHRGEDAEAAGAAECRAARFRLLASRVRTLTLRRFDGRSANLTIPLFPALENLHIVGPHAFVCTKALTGNAFGGCTLRHLLIDMSQPGLRPWVLLTSTWDLIERSSSALSSFELRLSLDHVPSLARLIAPRSTFPLLTSLSLDGLSSHTFPLLSLFHSSPLSSRHLRLAHPPDLLPSDPIPIALNHHRTTLTTFTCALTTGLLPAVLEEALHALCQSLGVPHAQQRTAFFEERTRSLDPVLRAAQTRRVCETARRAVEWVRERTHLVLAGCGA